MNNVINAVSEIVINVLTESLSHIKKPMNIAQIKLIQAALENDKTNPTRNKINRKNVMTLNSTLRELRTIQKIKGMKKAIIAP
tara:strand:- start:2593 stop:2841 length:249 start_codon:yes stop_codon:yes gene_type:complete